MLSASHRRAIQAWTFAFCKCALGLKLEQVAGKIDCRQGGTMRLCRVCLVAVALAGIAFAQAPANQNLAPNRLQLSQDDLRHRAVSVNMQDGTGRIKRPNTWESLTPEQKTFVDAVLKSPRGSRE